MIKIVLVDNNKVLGYVDNVTYVLKNYDGTLEQGILDIGIYTGILYNNTVYALEGRTDRETSVDGDIVRLENFNGGNTIFNNELSIDDLINQIISIQEFEIKRELDSALSDLDDLKNLDI